MAFRSNILVEYKILGQDIYCEPHVCSVRGHYSCWALTVLRWPICDCRDNCYHQLVAAMLPEQAFGLFWFHMREKPLLWLISLSKLYLTNYIENH